MKKRTYGFTLTELLIAVAIAGILASVAIPSYSEHVKRAARVEAVTALLDAANRQEQYFVDNRQYTSNLGDLGVNTTTENGYYSLTVNVGGSNFTLTAKPVGGPVKSDGDCGSFTITDVGLKGVGGSKSIDYCWG
ncbi:fimbrial protein [Pseudoalteromonas porphyrae]|uniref:Fimbrial protein n=1 Tax=Pseudoalteromonas porphyrae TaxID=187330 RepID=A0A0N0M1L1_9GAMM|nr:MULTISPECIES: type IV pilin protein [Pseudoalteromonas]KPH64769.1 fimbrial protein [Pseudoalteromonas porphyrae]KPH94640.1 fimbrial protein [Pseudoalteromonas porphyrae]